MYTIHNSLALQSGENFNQIGPKIAVTDVYICTLMHIFMSNYNFLGQYNYTDIYYGFLTFSNGDLIRLESI